MPARLYPHNKNMAVNTVLAPKVDVILLAQASMAGLAERVPATMPVPVLSSPQLAVGKVKEMLNGHQVRKVIVIPRKLVNVVIG